MSTELQLQLPQIRIPPIRSIDHTITFNDDKIKSENEENECRTPTSPANRIPAIFVCPPAPKKKRPAISCKRKLSELDFFGFVPAREEIDCFFRTISISGDQLDSNIKSGVKRRCP
ncbi:cyclin-dependent protein kinase inhibitor SMR3-like [Impatiens glandulifera]|uniref:cyclin-dependent protein kinase inhibitor SMR3-like n=1 Tax=Impatiens glandulifera TaxID=253017 RepID=UPI001FB06D62|nr:cyclin-dependent protein kinase inhibitor SMR3-like [Impatiens glandulifera]